jgi:sn-glycerol 3-phosphate transport system permease protein
MISLSTKQQQTTGKVAGYIGLALVVLVIGIPMFWMLSSSLKTYREVYTFPPQWIPSNPRWSNYKDAWDAAPFGRFYLNTVIITVCGTGLQLFNGILCAYALAFLKFPFKGAFMILILAALMIPGEVTILPNYLFMGNTVRDWFGLHSNWVNTYQGIFLPGAATAFGTFLMRQGFKGLPREVLEAARLDGAGHFRTMWDIVLPMARPIVVTFGVISVVNKWNDYLWPLIITNTDTMRPLTVGLTFLFDNEGNNQWGIIMAGTAFVIVPLLVVFLFAQRFIIEGLTAGATKG